jgi:hypothetical protein
MLRADQVEEITIAELVAARLSRARFFYAIASVFDFDSYRV